MVTTKESCRVCGNHELAGINLSLRRTQASVDPQCYGRALICQPYRDLPFHPS